MARNTEEIEKLEQKLNNLRLQLKQTKNDLSEKVQNMDRELTDLLRYFDLAIIETRADMSIINTYGNAETMFKPAKKMLERGGNLIKAVYKTTRNTKARSESGIEDYEELEDLEYTICKFVDSNREDRTINVIGEKDDGELFLLIWIIVRKDKIFQSYFRTIPTNQIIRETKKRYEKEIKDIRRNARDIYELISDGITILDLDGKILYMNSNANKGFLAYDNKLLAKASFEGRLFQEIFVTEGADSVKERLDYNKMVFMTKKPRSYKKVVGKKEVSYSVNPVFSDKGNVIGLVIVSHIIDSEKKNYDEKRLLKTLLSLTEDNKKHIERFKELELNEKWLMQKNTEYQEAIRMYYSFLESAPQPIGALELPSMKYIFINSHLEELFKLSRKEVIGKTDMELFDINYDELFKNDDIIEKEEIINIKIKDMSAMQKTLFGHEGQPSNIIRIFDPKR
jgi:PAS domain-containing protein